MRVLVLTHVFPRAATDATAPFLLDWARALRDAGVDVGVIAPHDAGLPGRHTVDGIPVRRVRYGSDARENLAYRGQMHRLARTPGGAARASRLVTALAGSVARQVRLGQPDVVAVHWWLPGAVAARLARVKVPVVLTVHGTDLTVAESNPAMLGLLRWALGGVDRVEAVSNDLADRLERLTGCQADAVNPMPLRAGLGEAVTGSQPHDGPLRLLAVGRLVPEKGFADLITACALLRRPVRCRVVGEGPVAEALQAQARALDVTLELLGRVAPEVVNDLYDWADVVVQPSHREGLGLVAAEALAHGLPVVATDCGGVRDLLRDTDLVPPLVAPGDVAGLAGAIGAVADDLAGARSAAGAIGRDVRALLCPAAAAQRTVAGYEALLR